MRGDGSIFSIHQQTSPLSIIFLKNLNIQISLKIINTLNLLILQILIFKPQRPQMNRQEALILFPLCPQSPMKFGRIVFFVV